MVIILILGMITPLTSIWMAQDRKNFLYLLGIFHLKHQRIFLWILENDEYFPHSGADIASTIDTRFLRELRLDLRLSAQSAKLGPITMTNMAAAARIEGGRATFDLGDAMAYGGNMLGRVLLTEAGSGGSAARAGAAAKLR